MSTAVDVLVFDEPQELNPAFRATLEHMPALHTVGEADLDRIDPTNAVALVFLDEARLQDGLTRLAALKQRLPALRTLVAFRALTGADLNALLRAGADAFVARSASPRELCTAVLALAEGAARLVARHETEIPVQAPEPADGLGLGLTPREAEVLRFLSAGFSNKEVARRLTLSVRTVETHRLNLRRKTQTGRLKDLVSLARQLGLAPVVETEPARRGVETARAATGQGPARH
ncbi:LuxR C-terminal-related transcriptional regulator [uncultured Methylobacterium sp.]|uniref:LuxR C-terminal-related transcriptional regulator n=1 Tax=uncultured Methylobacterium sp. TaxID=157278 RepID=UPI0035CC97C3